MGASLSSTSEAVGGAMRVAERVSLAGITSGFKEMPRSVGSDEPSLKGAVCNRIKIISLGQGVGRKIVKGGQNRDIRL
jgi:hypothetical protein